MLDQVPPFLANFQRHQFLEYKAEHPARQLELAADLLVGEDPIPLPCVPIDELGRSLGLCEVFFRNHGDPFRNGSFHPVTPELFPRQEHAVVLFPSDRQVGLDLPEADLPQKGDEFYVGEEVA